MNNEINLHNLGVRIQKYRMANNLTQEQLAELIGSNQKHISRIESGNHNINVNTLAAIAKVVHVPVHYLLADYDDSNNENTLYAILDDIRGMSAKQLDMLRDQIALIKKYE